MAALIDIADMGLRACRTIAMEIARPAAGVISRLYDNGPRIEAALEELQGLIERRRMIVRVTPTRLGTTRKQHDPEAGVRAAIGWLAESVQRVTGRPYCAAVAQGRSGKCCENNPAKGYGMAVGGVAVMGGALSHGKASVSAARSTPPTRCAASGQAAAPAYETNKIPPTHGRPKDQNAAV
jgi:hypothetical protein